MSKNTLFVALVAFLVGLVVPLIFEHRQKEDHKGDQGLNSITTATLGNERAVGAWEVSANRIQGQIDSAESFSARWDEIAGSDLWEGNKAKKFRQLVVEAARAGVSVESILNTVIEGTRPGENRLDLFAAAFSETSLNNEEIAAFLRDKPDETLRGAFRGIAKKLASMDNVGNLDPLIEVAKSWGNGSLDQIALGLANRLGIDPYASPEAMQKKFDEAISLVKQFEGDDPTAASSFLHRFLRVASNTMPRESLQILLESRGSLSAAQLQSAGQLIVRKLARLDPGLVLNEALEGRLDIEGVSAGQIAVMNWIKSDPIGLSDWYESNGDTLGGSLGSEVASGLAIYQAESRGFEEAWALTRHIGDHALLRQTEAQIWQAENRIVSEAARGNPKKILDSILVGDSQHADYWISTALDVWLASDAQEANAWVESNAGEMTPENFQHVARSLAGDAIARGDLDAARDWSAQIVTEKFRVSIESEIERAQRRGR